MYACGITKGMLGAPWLASKGLGYVRGGLVRLGAYHHMRASLLL